MARDVLDGLRRGLAKQVQPNRPKLRCLIVDDEAGIRRMMSFTFRELGAEVEDCSSIDEMLASLASFRPDIIFLDVCLDGADAVEAIRGLHQRGFGGLVQLMSGRETEVVEDMTGIGKQRGLDMLPFLPKPFRPADLKHLLHVVEHRAPSQCDPVLPGFSPEPRIGLEEALQQNWLELWYQPKLNIQIRKLAGAEGLIRARHPLHGILPPSAFLPGADEHALLALTEFVITRALRDWHELARDEPIRLAVNAPVSALTKLPIPALIREHAPKTPRWPGLIIEITEDEIVRDIALAQEVAAQLRLYNVSLAIDDFGSGYSSFARLHALPFCELKLDRGFVANCASNRTNEGIVQTIIDLAHRFGSVAVAEGIETKEELIALHQMRCDIGQGFLLARPMPKDEFAAMLSPHTQFRRAVG